MLLWRSKLAQERSRNRRRNLAPVAELKKSFFAEIDKVKNSQRTKQQKLKTPHTTKANADEGVVRVVVTAKGTARIVGAV
jgi:hypothetical protein